MKVLKLLLLLFSLHFAMALTSFLFTLLLSLGVVANPVVVDRSPVTLSLTRIINSTGVYNLLQRDQARAQVLKNRAFGRGSTPAAVVNEPVTNNVVSYVASVGVGSPATNCEWDFIELRVF